MATLADYIAGFDGEQKVLMEHLHEMLTSEFVLEPKLRYGIPFYFRKSWICYLNPLKNGKIELAFLRGHELSNEQGLLNAKDRKMVKGIELSELKSLPVKPLREIIHEAILVDENIPYSIKNINHGKI
jgi:hypothetical protein